MTFGGMFQRWYNDNKMRVKHPDVTKMLLFAALIPPSTAEVERTLSLMKVICTRLRVSLSQVNLAHCIRISKFRKLCKEDYKTILDRWLAADDTKSKKRKVRSRLRKYIEYHFSCVVNFVARTYFVKNVLFSIIFSYSLSSFIFDVVFL